MKGLSLVIYKGLENRRQEFVFLVQRTIKPLKNGISSDPFRRIALKQGDPRVAEYFFRKLAACSRQQILGIRSLVLLHSF